MLTVILNCHPDTPCPGVRRFEASVAQSSAGEFRLHYRIEGDIARLSFPEQTETGRCDELWRHTCCEAFLRSDRQSGYYEYNFSPSTAWALYRFSAYRENMAAVTIPAPPGIVTRYAPGAFDLEARVDLKPLAWLDRGLCLAFCAVIETRDGSLSYWAAHHPTDRPDFHHPEAYTIELPPYPAHGSVSLLLGSA